MMENGIAVNRIGERVDPWIVFRRVVGEIPSHPLGQDKIGKFVPFRMGLEKHRTVQQDRDAGTPQERDQIRPNGQRTNRIFPSLGEPLGLSARASDGH